jgi:hypothetical protein
VRLASVTLPGTVRSIGKNGFGECARLAAIAISKECQLHDDAFYGCNPRITTY